MAEEQQSQPEKEDRGAAAGRLKARDRTTGQLREALAGDCLECGSGTLLRQIENIPVALPAGEQRVDYTVRFCPHCGWSEATLTAPANPDLSQADLASIRELITPNLKDDVEQYIRFQQKLASLPMGLAYGPIGAALGFDGGNLGLTQQIQRDAPPETAYQEICAALHQDVEAPMFFQALAESAEG